MQQRRQARVGRSRWGALTGVLGLVGALLVTASAGAAPRGSTADPGVLVPASKITAGARAVLEQDGTAEVWVRLGERADTSAAQAIADRTERGQYVVDVLKQTAAESQADVRALLEAKGLGYETLWVTNAIRVSGVSQEAALDLAELDGVAEIRAPQVYQLPEPVGSSPAGFAPNGIEWGVANINADDVWAQLGVRGEGIVVASIDTGVQFDHPALVGSYRGSNGDGTFDHNYNWFDAQGTCPAAPCDRNGHGTHTMGTMVGDDGAGNQIGVAPGVTWITANGCCPSDAALLRSSEWMLAPTDLAGENPDVSKRPHIINNSWGTELPTNDPFLEDLQRAWADSGIFGVWSNGNNGPGCATSGSPGSRTLNYSVGAYDVNNTIASFSSRGAGQDGEIKPNISAPGLNVRSAVPGSGYGLKSGTSMAAPHVSGALALLWSGRPGLVGDIAGTRAALDVSAVDTPDDQCGGTPADNNVYGEGRLDALALLDITSGGIGTLAGTITTSDTGTPVPDATVTATGPIERTVDTDADGRYSMILIPGDYQVTVTGVFGYADTTRPVTLTAATTTSHDVALDPVPTATISGAVTDGSGRGGPLYATVTADDDAGHTFTAFTDPVTGQYTLPVVPDTTYTLTAAAVYPGYTPHEQQVTVATTTQIIDVALTIDLSCTAPGYQVELDGTTETFDHRPRRWTTTTNDLDLPGYGDSTGWSFTNPGGRTNTTGGTGGFAIVDSDHYGQHEVQDTTLTSPVFDLSDATTPAVTFATDLQPAVNSTATIELSLDTGHTWTTIWRNAGFPGQPGPDTQVVELPDAAGQDRAQVRFHYTGQWSRWWQLDNVFLGNRTCEPTPGGLIIGEVTHPTGTGITNATLTTTNTTTTTVTTPHDPAHGDGFYWLPAPAGEHHVTATTPNHPPVTATTTVHDEATTRLDLTP